MKSDDETICPGCKKKLEKGFNFVIAQGKGGLNIMFCEQECGEAYLVTEYANDCTNYPRFPVAGEQNGRNGVFFYRKVNNYAKRSKSALAKSHFSG